MRMIVTSDDVLSPEEAAEALGIGIATFWRWVKAGQVLVIKLQNRTLVPRSEIKRLKDEREGA